MKERVELVGEVDVYLVNEDGSVAKHIYAHNQLTEAFARWLLLGNLGAHESATVWDRKHTGNAISYLLYSSPYEKYEGTTTAEPNLKEAYQIAVGLCGKDDGDARFGFYALDCGIDIRHDTVYPPILSQNLATLDSTHLSWYSDAQQKEWDAATGEFNRSGKKWSSVKSNPIFTTSYVKVDGTAVVKSVLLAASYKSESETVPCVWVKQSPVELPNKWETEKEDEDSFYLIAPFIRSAIVNSRAETYREQAGISIGRRYGDGVYGTGYTDDSHPDNITFWDYGAGSFFTAEGGETPNPVNNEDFSTLPYDFVSDEVAGGYAIGNGKAIRVNKGETESSSRGYIGRSVKFTTQNKLTSTHTLDECYSPILYATEGTTIPATIAENAHPVMVAKRGAYNTEDRIEIFVSLGVGTFTEYTDENGYFHPGGTGVEIHKLVLYIDHYRYTATTLEMVIADNPEFLVSYGRVAVLPYAVGFLLDENRDSGLTYLTGSYDVPWDKYYLPITHILSGVNTLDWSFDGEGLEPILCATSRQQPGVVYHGCGWEFIRPCILGVDDTRLVHLSTNDGYLPLSVNRLRKWGTLTSMVMSGVTLPEPIQKGEKQRLVVNYSYGFKVVEELRGPVDITITDNLENSTPVVTITPGDGNAYLTIYRDRLPRGPANAVVYGPAIPSVGSVSIEDTIARQAVKYRYWAIAWNGVDNSDRVERIAWTPYRGASHNYLVCVGEGEVEDVPAAKDQIILDMRTGELYLDERLGEYEPKWHSTGEIKDGVFREFEEYDVRELDEEYIDVASATYGDGVLVVCPERQKMYLVYNHNLIPIDCSSIKRI